MGAPMGPGMVGMGAPLMVISGMPGIASGIDISVFSPRACSQRERRPSIFPERLTRDLHVPTRPVGTGLG